MATSAFFVLRVALFAAALCTAHAWGVVGHELTADIAQQIITQSAFSFVSKFVQGGQMATVADWADQIRHQYPWSDDLHYIDAPDWACTFSHARDCSQDACVAGAIYNYTRRVMDTSISFDQQVEAIKFIIHFLGDIHQPLHCGFTSDKGGNLIKGHWLSKQTNLHEIWDDELIKDRLHKDFDGSERRFASFLVSKVTTGEWAKQAAEWAHCDDKRLVCADTYGMETAEAACKFAYVDSQGQKIQSGFHLGDDYYNFTMISVEMSLAKGGVRLAALLNRLTGAIYRRPFPNEDAQRDTVGSFIQAFFTAMNRPVPPELTVAVPTGDDHSELLKLDLSSLAAPAVAN